MTTTDFFNKIKGNWNYQTKFYIKDEYGQITQLDFEFDQDDDIYKEKAIYFTKSSNNQLML